MFQVAAMFEAAAMLDAAAMLHAVCRLRRRSSRAAAIRFVRGRAGGALIGGRVASRQRIVLAIVQPANSVAVESCFLDFEMRAEQMRGRQFLDRKADRFRGLGETPIGHRPASLSAACRKQLRRGAIVKSIHVQCLECCATSPGRRRMLCGAGPDGQERAGKASELHPAGGAGGNPSSQSWWYARVSSDRCMRSSSSRSVADLALTAKAPHAAASRRCFKALDVSGNVSSDVSSPADIALSFVFRRERKCLSAIGAWIPLSDVGYANDPESIHLLYHQTYRILPRPLFKLLNRSTMKFEDTTSYPRICRQARLPATACPGLSETTATSTVSPR